MILQTLLLVTSLGVMVLGAECLVRGSVGIATRLGLSSFFVGLTIVGFGTSTPELSTSLIAAARGSGDVAMGNVVGSNIFNLAVILGLTALFCPIPLKYDVVRREVRTVILVALVPFVALVGGGRIDRWAGIAMVVLLGVYLFRAYARGQREGITETAADPASEDIPTGPSRLWLSSVLIIAGLALLIAGSWLLVRSATDIARGLGISELVIGLTIVAAGTSAPELVTSITAALRKQPDVSVGNILGSNIFNVLGILGLTCAILPQTVTRQTLYLDLPLMLALSVACIPIMRSGARISRTEGALFLGVYAAYMVVLFCCAPAWFS